jgi:phosphoribosyl 1,2-cyclic phosphodiesterase
MWIRFAGVRGSWPRTAPRFARYGGDTTCLQVTPRDGPPVFVDAGTGITAAAELLPRPGGDLLLLLTHTHHDHLQGFPSLGPLYEPDWRLTVAAPDFVPAEAAVRKLMEPPLWPLALDSLRSTVSFRRLPTVFAWGSLAIRHLAVPHPGGGAAYRLDESGGGSLVFATDIEWGAWDDAGHAAFARFCREPRLADLLVMDGQFTDDELPARRGWGHSSLGDCVAAARAGGVGRLLTTHHSPDRDDAAMAAVETALADLLEGAAAARQGQELEL